MHWLHSSEVHTTPANVTILATSNERILFNDVTTDLKRKLHAGSIANCCIISDKKSWTGITSTL